MVDISNHLNVTPTTVGRWKNGVNDMGGYEQELLADFLNLEISVKAKG